MAKGLKTKSIIRERKGSTERIRRMDKQDKALKREGGALKVGGKILKRTLGKSKKILKPPHAKNLIGTAARGKASSSQVSSS
jgi:hypothetical protein